VKLFPTLGLPVPTDDDLLDVRVTVPFKYGEVYVWNNNLRNLGFTKACNEGLRYGLNNGFDVIWFLNNDTQVPDLQMAIQSMEAEFSANSETGIVGHKILAMDDPDFIHHGGTGACVPSGVHKVGRVSMGQLNERTLERWVTGASFAVTAGCALEIGTMDEKMVSYGSDSDYCYRARLAGFKVVYLPIPIIHKIGQSQTPSPEQMRVIKADMLYFQSKWMFGKVFYDLDSEQLV
jgi:GT2 family glycosyltransferase